MYAGVYARACVRVCVYAVGMHVCMHARVYVVGTHVCMHARVCVCTY